MSGYYPRYFGKQKNNSLKHTQAVLHSLQYEENYIIETVTFQEKQHWLDLELRLENGIVFAEIDELENSLSPTQWSWHSKYRIGNVVTFYHNVFEDVVTKYGKKCKRITKKIKKRINDIKLLMDDSENYSSKIINILYILENI